MEARIKELSKNHGKSIRNKVLKCYNIVHSLVYTHTYIPLPEMFICSDQCVL